MSAYDIHAWVEFGVAVAGAAAVLTGLVFVAVSINLVRVLAVPGVPDRAGESVVMFLAVLIYSLFLLVPGQSTTALGVGLLVSGLVFAAVLVLVAALGSGGRRSSRCRGRSPASWRCLGSSVPAVVAGVSLMAEPGGGIYWLFAAIVLAFLAGIGNAWVLLVEVVRDERYRPASAPRLCGAGFDCQRPGRDQLCRSRCLSAGRGWTWPQFGVGKQVPQPLDRQHDLRQPSTRVSRSSPPMLIPLPGRRGCRTP